MGIRPRVRGSAMNPIAHPMGGGEGRNSGGRHPCSPSGKLAKGGRTRSRKKASSKAIIRRRRSVRYGQVKQFCDLGDAVPNIIKNQSLVFGVDFVLPEGWNSLAQTMGLN